MTTMTEPARSRAVLSNQDFKLLQEAVREYIQAHDGEEATAKYVNLFHRLGSAGGR
jgi:hypothetical protein